MIPHRTRSTVARVVVPASRASARSTRYALRHIAVPTRPGASGAALLSPTMGQDGMSSHSGAQLDAIAGVAQLFRERSVDYWLFGDGRSTSGSGT